MLLASAKSKLGCAVGCGLTGSVLDHGRVMVGSVSDRPRTVNDVSAVSPNFCQIWGGHFAWQAQYLVRLEGDTGCLVQCK